MYACKHIGRDGGRGKYVAKHMQQNTNTHTHKKKDNTPSCIDAYTAYFVSYYPGLPNTGEARPCTRPTLGHAPDIKFPKGFGWTKRADKLAPFWFLPWFHSQRPCWNKPHGNLHLLITQCRVSKHCWIMVMEIWYLLSLRIALRFLCVRSTSGFSPVLFA